MADRAGIENRKSLEAWPLDFPEFPTILKQRFSRGLAGIKCVASVF
jgi:hypothetical protein